MTRAADEQGTIDFRGYRTWYRRTGTPAPDRPTVVVVHGGPGSTHDYLVGLADLADDGWPVVHYDQLGNGRSTHLRHRGAAFWTPELFLAELQTVVQELGVAGNYMLLGHSWGGLLAAAHAAGRPAGLRGLVVANSPASYPTWLAEMARLRESLPAGVDDVLRRHEDAGTTDDPAYHEAVRVFERRHVCRLADWPRELTATLMEIRDDPTVYHTMNGPTEFHVVGTLKDWSVTERLPDVAVATLVVSGRHDEATADCVRPFVELIPDAVAEVFDDSSHMPHLEEPARFRAALIGFLSTLVGSAPRGQGVA